MKLNKLLVVITAASISGPALAQTASDSMGIDTSLLANTSFATIDTDMSGAISFEELAVLVPTASQDQFAAADTDDDGELSEAEYEELVSGGMTQ